MRNGVEHIMSNKWIVWIFSDFFKYFCFEFRSMSYLSPVEWQQFKELVDVDVEISVQRVPDQESGTGVLHHYAR